MKEEHQEGIDKRRKKKKNPQGTYMFDFFTKPFLYFNIRKKNTKKELTKDKNHKEDVCLIVELV